MLLSFPSNFEKYFITSIKPIRLEDSPILQKEVKENSGIPLEVTFSNKAVMHIFANEIRSIFLELSKRNFYNVAVENILHLLPFIEH